MNYSDRTALPGFRIDNECLFEGDGTGLTALLTAGMQWLEQHVQLLNQLNVFPVPDGDTGTNLFLTIRAAVNQAAETDSTHAGQIATAAARGALLGARGNSGVILSQLLQGIARHLADRPVFSAADFSTAWQLGVKLAYQGVAEPVEGTMLTVAAAAQTSSRDTDDLASLLTAMLEAAQIALGNTPNLLPVLKEAGVTDAGGQGLVYMLTGMVQLLTGQTAKVTGNGHVTASLSAGSPPADYGYDVQFLLHGNDLDTAKIRADMQQMGHSVVVGGSDRLVKVHVHTADPGRPLSYGAQRGALADVVVENMTRQAAQQQRGYVSGNGSNHHTIQVMAMAPGHGFVNIFNSLGVAHTIVGNRRHQPDLDAIRGAVAKLAPGPILMLPDSPTRGRVGHQAKQALGRAIHIVPTRSVAQALTAVLAFNQQTNLEANIRQMSRAAAEVQTVTITRATRSATTTRGKIEAGDFLALLEGRLVAIGRQPKAAVLDSFGIIEMVNVEVISLYFGQSVESASAQALAAHIKARYPHLDVEVHSGAQTDFEYIISLE